MTQRDIWTEINSRPPRIKRPFGAALEPAKRDEIITPQLVSEPTRRITRPELLRAMRGVL